MSAVRFMGGAAHSRRIMWSIVRPLTPDAKLQCACAYRSEIVGPYPFKDGRGRQEGSPKEGCPPRRPFGTST